MSPPAFTEVNQARISSMGFGYSCLKVALNLRHRDQVNVIWHQTICPNLNPEPATPIRHQGQIFLVITVMEKDFLASVATLSNVMGYVRNHYSSYSRHVIMITGDPEIANR